MSADRPAPPNPGKPERVGSWGEVAAALLTGLAVLMFLLWPLISEWF